MGTFPQWIYTTCSVLLAVRLTSADHRAMYMVKSPEPIAAPLNDEVTFECEMNIRPDKFRWRHFPLINNSNDSPQIIDTGRAIEVPVNRSETNGKKSTLIVDLSNPSAYGDYQCLVTYGVSVLASVLGRAYKAEIEDFGPKHIAKYVVPVGNTVPLRCDIPRSTPSADVQYFKSNVELNSSLVLPTKTLLLQNVSVADAGTYTCSAKNYISGESKKSRMSIVLVTDPRNSPMTPKFLTQPPSNYTVTAGEDVFLECSAVGYPPPKVTWYKLSSMLPKNRSELVPGGLKISNVTLSDEGTYVCSYENLKHHIMLLFYEHPNVSNLPMIETKEGKDHDAECIATGTPEPKITWLINGQSVTNDSNIEAIGKKIYFRPVEKRHAGIIQCFATNAVGTGFSFSFIRVYPKPVSSSSASYVPSPNTRPPRRRKKGRRNKIHKTYQAVMTPPSKPNITRVSDYAVMVRWSVPENNGLPISFFKVQYRELGPANPQNQSIHGRSKGSRWKTTNADITPYLRSYQVENLKPDHIYKFRIAAVYSNNDNKLGSTSAKFHLKREDFYTKNPIPAPRLTHTESHSPTEIKIHWEYTPDPNVTVEGFYVNYIPASSAGDYFQVTVDGEHTRSYIIHHLQPDTNYDIKIQSYTSNSVSDFSQIMKQKTMRPATESPDVELLSSSSSNPVEDTGLPMLYIIIGGAGLGVVILIVSIVALCVVKKRRSTDSNDKSAPVTEDGGHHIQADSNGYIAKPVPHNLTNGCSPSRGEITITSNPLADADDNQNQNMIEMACLSPQNNNCSNTEPSVSNESEQSTSPKSKNKKDSGKNRGKLKPEASSSSENYV